MSSLFLKPIVTSFFISLFATPVVIKIFRKQGWLEDPKKEKRANITHQTPIPRGGGIGVFLAIISTSLIFLSPDNHLRAVLTAALITLMVGVLDDIFHLSPYLRIVTNALAAIIVIRSGIGIKFITNPLGGILDLEKTTLGAVSLSDLITLIWIVWCMNIIGFSAGIAGQLPGFVAITSFVIGILSLRFRQDITQWPVIVLAGAVAGSYLGFLPFNFFPQKMMPGYSGKSLAGFFLAVLAILSGAKLATVILTLAVPMVDGVWTIIRRIYQGKMPVWGDAEHLHHLLLKAGLPQPAISISYWLFSAILGMVVLQLNSRQKLWAFFMVAAGVSILIITLRRVVKKNHSNFSA